MAKKTTPEASPQAQQPIERWTAKRRAELVRVAIRAGTFVPDLDNRPGAKP